MTKHDALTCVSIMYTLFINIHIKLSVQDSKDLLIESLQKELQRLQKENSELKVENIKLKGGQVCKEFQNLSVFSRKANKGFYINQVTITQKGLCVEFYERMFNFSQQPIEKNSNHDMQVDYFGDNYQQWQFTMFSIRL